jgi:hypothetical protein
MVWEFTLIKNCSFKVDEHGVYFFDPFYYEQTEPFHESLRTCVKESKVQNTRTSVLLLAMVV